MTNTDTTAIGTLDVPGARLHYETRGSGPTLLLIPGGPMDGRRSLQWCRHLPLTTE
jgi:pimeloyl-ACP methyl ester carboxylesterase